jgi:hypothetical protein
MMIYHTNGPYLYGLIYQEYLEILPIDQHETMERSLRNSSDAWVGYHGDKVLGFAGVIPPTLLSDSAYFWLYTTPHFAARRLSAARVSRRLVADCLSRYPILVGHCTAQSSRWLQWLGATLGEPQGPVIPFRIEAR